MLSGEALRQTDAIAASKKSEGMLSHGGYTLMRSWGVPDESIAELVGFVSQFEGKYAHPLEKVSAINHVYVYQAENFAEVVIPHAYDVMGRKAGGQCYDLALLLAARLTKTSSWFAEAAVLAKNVKGIELELVVMVGGAPDFFRKTTHVYLGLRKKPKEDDHELGPNFIVIDPAFQKITQYEGSGYKLFYIPPVSSDVEIRVHDSMGVGNFNPEKGSISQRDEFVLGLSLSGEWYYSLSFLHVGETTQLIPSLRIIAKDESVLGKVVLVENSLVGKGVDLLPDGIATEVKSMLSILNNVTYSYITKEELREMEAERFFYK